MGGSGNKYGLFILFFTGLFSAGLVSYGFTTDIRVDSVSCNGGSDGRIVVTVSGGTAPYIFTWSTGRKDTTDNPADSLLNLAAGSYWVVIDDAGGSDFHSVTVYEPDPINIDQEDKTDVSCHGGNDGTITIQASGGTSPYSFSIDGGSTYWGNNGFFTGLAAGDYPIMVMDAHGCTRAGSTLTVAEPPSLAIQTDSVGDVSCSGAADGAIDVTVTGGTPPYSYSWSGPGGYTSTSEDISGLAPGDYVLTVTDAHGCTYTGGAITVGEPQVLTVTMDSKQDVICNGVADGAITVTVAGGTPPYAYLWTGPGGFSSTVEDLSGLAPGDYSLTVTDARGCTAGLGPVTIAEPPATTVTADAVADVTCPGGSDGAIQVTVSGGTPPYVYQWTGPGGYVSTSEDISGLVAGAYILTVTDAHACSYIHDTIRVAEPSLLVISVTKNDISCYGSADGTLTLTVTGGVAPYAYSIDGGASFHNNGGIFTGLGPGSYTPAVRDAHGCIQSGNPVTVNEPSQVVISSEVKTDVTCHGAADGTITVTAAGGVAPYVYSIDGGVTWQDNGGRFTGLAPGSYTVAVRDSHGCERGGSTLVVQEPAVLAFTSQTATDVTCHGGYDGTITLTVTGGTPPYAYSVDGGSTFVQNGGVFGGLGAGSYTTAVRDANGCVTAGGVLNITEPPALVISNVTHTDVTCNGGNDGTITIQASGGTAPYVYSVDGGSTFADNGGLFAGLYAGARVPAVRDARGCIMTGDTVTIAEPEPLVIVSIDKTDISCHGLADGRIDITASGGTAPLEYSIDGGATFSGSHLFESLAAGDYDIAVRDARGCLFTGNTVTVTDPPLLAVSTVTVSDVLCAGGSSGSIRILATGGTGAYEYSLDNGHSYNDNSGLFGGLPAGTYTPAVRDLNGCTASSPPVTVAEPSPIQVSTDTVKPSCSRNSFDGEIRVQAAGGTGSFVYSIDNGVSFVPSGTFTGLEGGTYTVIARDANGCTESVTVILEGKFTVVADAGRDTAVCPGMTVRLQGSGGQSYRWEPASLLDDPAVADPVAAPVETTDFILTVTSGVCYDRDTVTVTVYPVYGLDAGRDTVIPEGSSITLTATEGFSSYSWYPPEGLDATTGRSVVATPERETTYYVEATTLEGCLEKDSVNIGLAQKIFIPSGFTPNGDGTNDTWHFGNAEYYPDITVEVFDRWGHRVFYSRGYDSSKEWDGTYKGKPLDYGTYYYVVILHDATNTPPLTGPVTIVR